MASIALRHRVVALASILVAGPCASPAQAAFVSCEDAHNYGANSARLFVGQSFARIGCNPALLERVHLGLDRVLSRQVLRSHDSDDEKGCFYQGMFEGLVAQLDYEYAECVSVACFPCLSGTVLSSHVGSLLSALSVSLSDPSTLDVEGVVALFASSLVPSPASLCSYLDPELCAESVRESMSPFAQATFPLAPGPLGALVCAP